jgi:hypothetical protein
MREQLRGGPRIAGRSSVEEFGNVGHAYKCNGRQGGLHEQPGVMPASPPTGPTVSRWFAEGQCLGSQRIALRSATPG